VSVEKATELKNLYFEKLGNISNFISRVKDTINRRGFIFNFAGRVLHFPQVKFLDDDGIQRTSNFAYKGPNYIIQSSGSEIMRKALILVHEFLTPYKSKLVLSIHDEAMILMAKEELHLIPEIRRLMCLGYTPKNGLGMDTSVAIGESWGSLTDIDETELSQRIVLQKAGNDSLEATT